MRVYFRVLASEMRRDCFFRSENSHNDTPEVTKKSASGASRENFAVLEPNSKQLNKSSYQDLNS